MTTALLTEDTRHPSQAAVRPMEATYPKNRDTCRTTENPTKITCFTIYIDSISRKVFTEFQTSNDAQHTLAGKHRMEKEAASFDVTIKPFRADNGIFRAQEFMIDIKKKNQSISFRAVNEHSQNGIAEHFIRTIVERARTSLLHASTKWPTVISTELWTTFTVNYAVHQWNHTPLEDLKWFTPEEVFTGVKDENASYKNNAMSKFTHLDAQCMY